MEKELLKEIKEYIEEAEVLVECEWGFCRGLEELKKAKEMPDLYYKILKELNNK